MARMGERIGEILEKETTLEYLGVVGRIILKWMLKKWVGGMDSIDVAQDRGK